MGIRSRVWFSIIASVVIAVAVSFSVYSLMRGISEDMARGRAYHAVIEEAYILNILIGAYRQQPVRQTEQQLDQVQASLVTLLKGASSPDILEESLLAGMRDNAQDVRFLLDQFLKPRDAPDSVLEIQRNATLASQLVTKVRFITDDARQLIGKSQVRIKAAHRKAAIFVLVLLGALVLTNVGLFYASSASIVRRIRKLGEGARHIARGDLSHRVEGLGSDELGELAKLFNEMSHRLKESHEELVRKGVELRGVNEELEFRVRERTAELEREAAGHRRTAEERRQAKEEAEQASRAKSEFLANMSHEIRTPMNGVLGMTQLALMSSTESDVKEYLKLVQESGKNLLDIINDILDLSKIESGKTALEHQPFLLRPLIDSALMPLSIQAQEKNLAFTQSVGADVPEGLVGDAGRLRQVLTNLVGNAVKFTESGEVAVTVALAGEPATSPDLVRIRFIVSDTGIGIPHDKLGQIFESFSQASDTVKYGGTGLGLTISRELVEMMGGSIHVESEPGKGSLFSFDAQFGLDEGRQALEPGESRAAGGLSPLKVLLVEDNMVNQILALELLKREGHAVTTVVNGREAIEALKRDRYDLVLMDARMPEMSGEEATRRIRGGETLDPAVPIVALTAHALKGDRERFLAAGMDEYLSKPVSAQDLGRVLKRVMSRRITGKSGGIRFR